MSSSDGTTPQSTIEGSRAGLWTKNYALYEGPRRVYDDTTTAFKGAEFLNQPDITLIEDWGCGYGGLKGYLAPHQTYRGIDGSETGFQDAVVDLTTYRSTVDAVFLRHVIEHNPCWGEVLTNALHSFQKRMVLILFTPFSLQTGILQQYPNWNGSGITMVDIAFQKEDITRCFKDCTWSLEENLQTQTQYGVEHIFYLTK